MKLDFRIFVPNLAGATLRDRLFACLGALIGIGVTGAICSLLYGANPHLPLLVAPMGASAVLLFAVPSSPLAQPWSILGGNTISALVGVTAARAIHDPAVAAAAAVAFSIGVMSVLRCLHPPGGAAALTAVLGGPAVASAGYMFPLVPVGLNSLALVLCGIAFHKLYGQHSYPHVAAAPPVNAHGTADEPASRRVGFRRDDIDAALADMHESFDIDRADLDRLLEQVELRAFARVHGDLRCLDLMSRDLVKLRLSQDRAQALRLLLDHGLRILPVVDDNGRLIGAVGLRELAGVEGPLEAALSPPATATPESPAFDLLAPLVDGQTRAVFIVDAAGAPIGVVTQTDQLAALSRSWRWQAG